MFLYVDTLSSVTPGGKLMHSARFLLLLSTVAPGIVVLLPNWRACFFAMTSPTLLFVFYAWLIPESPLWLLHMGYEDEADAILVEIAEKNGTPISDNLTGGDGHM